MADNDESKPKQIVKQEESRPKEEQPQGVWGTNPGSTDADEEKR